MRIDVRGLSFSYGTRRVLRDVSFSAAPGELVSVLGPNGAGKSTMFRCIMGFLKTEDGQVVIDGAGIGATSRRALAERLAYVPQTATPVFNHTVLETVLMGLTGRIGFGRAPKASHRAAALETLDNLGIAHLADRGCMELSGGERQLAFLARALVQNARILIMDEPTANLDYGRQHSALARARALAASGYTIITSTHNPEHAFLYATKVLALCDGRIAACGKPGEVLTEELLEKLYGIGVRIHDIPGEDGSEAVRICLPGAVKSDIDRERFENAVRRYGAEAPSYDGWLDKYFDGGGAGRTVLELGCGTGGDTSFLATTGCELTCCDFSKEALKRITELYPGAATREFNLKDRFPFDDGAFDTVTASLCLHFFDEPTLQGILSEIRRVMTPNGLLLCRLNSANDRIEGLPGETELAPGAYMTQNGFKRFYDESAARAAFKDWNVEFIKEVTTVKFSKPKSLWELALRPNRSAPD
jgi:iron complex transport system ATP-binding protein